MPMASARRSVPSGPTAWPAKAAAIAKATAVWPEGKEKTSGFSTSAAKPPMPRVARLRRQSRLRGMEGATPRDAAAPRRGGRRGDRQRQERRSPQERAEAGPRAARKAQRQPQEHPARRVPQMGEPPHQAGHQAGLPASHREEQPLVDREHPPPDRFVAQRDQATSSASSPVTGSIGPTGGSRVPGPIRRGWPRQQIVRRKRPTVQTPAINRSLTGIQRSERSGRASPRSRQERRASAAILAAMPVSAASAVLPPPASARASRKGMGLSSGSPK